MVILGIYFIFITALGTYLLYRKKLFENQRNTQNINLVYSIALLACQLGWIAAEVGRQPWIVYKLMKTSDAVSVTVGTGELIFSIILFFIIYLLLGSMLFISPGEENKKGT